MTDTPHLVPRVPGRAVVQDEPNGPDFDVVGNDGHTEERLPARGGGDAPT